MKTFKQLAQNTNIHELINTTFDADLPLKGGWGYSKENPTIINSLPTGTPLLQLEHMVSTIRAHLEMNITQDPDNRYAGINVNERAREEIKTKESILNKVTYEVTGIKEYLYTSFIKEYKTSYGQEDFDLNAHFKKRKDATLTREVIYYFDVTSLL
jgi:hypothetical protein